MPANRRTISIELTPEMYDLLGDAAKCSYPFPRHSCGQVALRLGLRLLKARPELLQRYVDDFNQYKSERKRQSMADRRKDKLKAALTPQKTRRAAS